MSKHSASAPAEPRRDLRSELLHVVDALDKVRRLMAAASNLAADINDDELDPMMTVMAVAEDELDAARNHLDVCRLRPKDVANV